MTSRTQCCLLGALIPNQFNALVKPEVALWAKILKESGVKQE